MTTYRRKLIEVDLPLDDINRESAREKSIRHGHPCTLHMWWARRPLAACRAVIFASMVDDPSSCPDDSPQRTTNVPSGNGSTKSSGSWLNGRARTRANLL